MIYMQNDMKQQKMIVEVDGLEYVYWISRDPQWCHEDGWQGVQVTVELAKRPNKQLLIQLPFSIESRASTPHMQRPKIADNDVEGYIKAAIESGWAPESKGKPYRYLVE